VPVNDDFSEIILGEQKILSNPEQICLILIFEGDARSDTGVNKKEIAAEEPSAQGGQEDVVGLGEDVGERPGDPFLFVLIEIWLRHNPVGQQGLHSAEFPPLLQHHWIMEELGQNRLVVPFQIDRLVKQAPVDQTVDDLTGSRPAIDIVPEKHFNRARYRAGSEVGVDP